MVNTQTRKGRLPACVLSRNFIEDIWNTVGQTGDVTWQAIVGTCSDLLGEKQDVQQGIYTDREQLFELLSSLPRIDSVQLIIEIAGKGVVDIDLRNYNMPQGRVLVSGDDVDWVEFCYNSILQLFKPVKVMHLTMLYSLWGYPVIHSIIPISVAFVIVMVGAGVLIPSSIRHSELVWWITTGTLLGTLLLASAISDRLICYCLRKFPYIRWSS